MGWRGMKNSLPSKALPLFSSRRKDKGKDKGKDKAEGGSGEQLKGYFANETVVPIDVQLNTMFDSLKRDPKQDTKDALGVTSTMEYFRSDLGINIENAELLVAFEIVRAPSVGCITRGDYVDGWKTAGIPASTSAHKNFVRSQIAALKNEPALFRRVYRYTFVAGKEASQKSMDHDTAMVYWEMLFSHPCAEWKTATCDWFALWKRYLDEVWSRSVNRDMWNQVLEFAVKSMEDPTLSFWSVDGAWPGVIDDFVAWSRAAGAGVVAKGAKGAQGREWE